MLHIILLILKILGLLILGILGLIVLLTAVVLLAPAGYSLEASGKDTPESLRGRLKFHWLFRLISGEMEYKDGGLAWRMRAGWKKFGSGMEEDAASGKAGASRFPRPRASRCFPAGGCRRTSMEMWFLREIRSFLRRKAFPFPRT